MQNNVFRFSFYEVIVVSLQCLSRKTEGQGPMTS